MEDPVKIIQPRAKNGFTIVLFVRLIVAIPIFCVSIFMIVNGIIAIQIGNLLELFSLTFGVIFFVIIGRLLYIWFIANPKRIKQLRYALYTDKLVIFNFDKKEIIRTVPYAEIEEFSFHENLNDFGYIIIGKEVPLVGRNQYRLFRWGVSMNDAEIMLENLPNVKKEYYVLKELIDRFREMQKSV